MPGPLPKYPIQLTLEQEGHVQQLSPCYTAPCAEVQRARILLLAYQHPTWCHAEVAQRVGCCVNTVTHWRLRWQQTTSVHDAPRAGTRRTCTPLQRAQMTALAWSTPRAHGKPWPRWSGEKLAPVAIAPQSVEPIAPGTLRTWLRQDKSKPWRSHSWQHSTDPQCVDKASPVLDLYEHAPALAAPGEGVVCSDEKTSIQARQRVSATKAAAPGYPLQVADRSKWMGAVQLFCALLVASDLTFARTRSGTTFADCKAFLLALLQSALCAGLPVVHLLLDNGSTHAPKPLGPWIASLALAFVVRIYWLPTHASWLDQVEIIFSKVQRDVLTPNDFPSPLALEKQLKTYFAELNRHPKPMQWTYTKTTLLTKFGTSQPVKLAA
jgi:DDE superfamily endonuclease/Homeodomain-like domain-containing protein